ncbi:MAG TPA: ABC transporter ATP-binding protein [Hymenobacter sp.]|jgi:lipopolysaccharide transport system ATP-binding protein|uniref:ABC transporter ATP-binding protein n=1 Tax=Hymenobacter sp. TaxID=1898978 RepID=UPI002ED77E70
MSNNVAIQVQNLGKLYRLGEIGTGSLSQDLSRTWAKLRGKEDPFAIIGETNDRTAKGSSDFVWSLKDVSFDVKEGEVLGIIGRNGAGKSTLLKILSKVTAPTTGKIKIKGRIASLLEVGTGFHPELTGRENIFLNGAILGMSKAEIRSKFDEIVDFSGVARYIDTPVKRYSSGMYVRLAFAVAAFLEPEILIVDEVLAVGDAEFQKKCIGRMKDVSVNDGRTVLFVSHNMSAIKELCHSALMMVEGKVSLQSDISTVINTYLEEGDKSASYENLNEANGKGQILSVKFFNESGINTNSFVGFSNPYLIVQYNLERDSRNFNIGMIVSDIYENNIYSSADTDLNEQLVAKRLAGYYSVKVPLPLHNLNTGYYKVKLLMGIINTEVFDSVELSFNIENNNFLNTGVRPGLIISLNKWEY